MEKFASLLLTILIFGTNYLSAAGGYIGCYEEDVGAPTFYVIPSGCDTTKMTVDWCTAACRENSFSFAGLNDGTLCACAQDITQLKKSADGDCNSPCSGGGGPANQCGGPNSLFSVFEFGEGGGQLSGVTLLMNKENPMINEVLDFNIGLESGTDVSYSLDYGDNCPGTSFNATDFTKHTYLVPNQYTATVSAKAAGLDKVETATAEFSVGSTLSEINTLDCPAEEMAEDEDYVCVVTISRGQNIKLSADQGDGSGLQPITQLDSSIMVLGTPCFPPMDSASVLTDFHPTAMIIPRNSIVQRRGFISQFEVITAQANTAITITFFRAQCSDPMPFCPDVGRCARTCPEECPDGQPFDPATSSCMGAGPMTASPPSYVPTGPPVTFTLMEKGYKLLSQLPPIEVSPGDVVAYKTGPGPLAYSTESDDESDETAGDINSPRSTTGKSYYFRTLISEAVSVDIPHTYAKSGVYMFKISLGSDIPTDTRSNTTKITVLEPISDVQVASVPQFSEATKPTTLNTVIATGSYFSILWDFGDGDSVSTDHTEITPGTPFTQAHIYQKEGVYEVTVNASNAFSTESASCIVIVQWPVTEKWELNISSPKLIPPGSVTGTVKYVGDPATLPTNVSILIQWGDNELPINVTMDPKTDNYAFEHVYQSPGEYVVTAAISNLISTFPLTGNAVLVNVLGITSAEPYTTDEKTKMRKPGSGKFLNTFASEEDIYMEVTYDGDMDGYIVEFENGTLIGKFTVAEGIKFRIEKDGSYTIKIYGYNNVEKKSKPITKVIDISGALQHIFISDFAKVRDKNETKHFQFSFDAFPVGICMFIDYNDNTMLESYGEEAWCKKNMSGATFQGPLTNPLKTMHIYETRAVYDLFAKACTSTSCTAANFEFTVTLLKCEPAPSAVIADAYTNPAFPKKYMKSKAFKTKTNAKIKCSVPIDIKRKWSIFKIHPYNLTVMEEVLVEDILPSWNKSMIAIPKLFLDLGLYRMQFTTAISIKPKPVNKFSKQKPEAIPLPYQFSFSHYVNITFSPLVPILIKGAMTEVIRGYGQDVEMEAAKLTYDPDNPDSNVFTVDWFCSRMVSEIPDDELKGTSPNFDKSNVVKILPPTGNHTHPDKGGCFGTGPGLVNFTESNWVLNTLSLYKKNVTYNITAVIRRDIRVVTAWLLIRVVNGMPPEMSVKCLNEDQCIPTPRGLLINPNYRLALKGECEGDCPVEPIFQWIVVSVNMDQGLKKTPIYGLESYVMTEDDKGPEYALNETFFAENTDINIFGFELHMSGGEEMSQAGLFIRINNAPHGGKCSLDLSPENERPGGYALFSIWLIKCWDWEDYDGNEVNKYSYFTKQYILDTNNDTIEWRFNLLFDTAKQAHVVLPCGEQTVTVEIFDDLGAFTEYPVNTTTPILPPIEEFKAFKRTSWMQDVLASGDQYRFIQMIQAVSSFAHCYPPKDFSNMTADEIRHYEEERKKEESEEKVDLLEGMIDSAVVSDMDDMVIISNAVTSVVGTGEESAAKERDLAIHMVGTLNDVLNDTDIAAPEAMLDLTKNVLQIVGAVIEGDCDTVKNGDIAPSDLEHIDEMYYDTRVEEDFEMPQSKDDMLKNAVRDAQKEKSEEHAGSMDNVMETIQNKVFNSMAVNEQMFTVDTKSTAAAFAVIGGNESLHETPELGAASFALPNTCVLLNLTGDDCNDTLAVGLSTMTSLGIMNSFGKGLDLLGNDTSSVKIELFSSGDGQDNSKLEVGGLDSEPVDVMIPKGGGESIERKLVVPKMKWFEHMVYHQVIIDKSGSALSLEIGTTNGSGDYLLFFRSKKKPILSKYDFMVNLAQEYTPDYENTYKLFFDVDRIGNDTGEYYLGVAQLSPNVSSEPIEGNYTKDQVTRNFTSNYTFLMYTSGCYYYDEFFKEWKGDGCKVFNATPFITHCKCTHLTTFAGGFFVMPNTIDFAYVFANASFADNLTIYVTIIVTVVVYILLLLWARRKDKRDREKIGALPLPDNNPRDKYFYEILVFTGHNRSASTESKVSFVLSGDRDETDVRTFGTQPRKVFRRDGVDVFVMAVPRPLGQLQFLRIWHDNSGKGTLASWYLNYVMFRDVQTGEKFDFIAESWFAVEEDDGLIDRIVPVAGKEQLTEFGHLFNTTSRKNLSDGHIWFSVFLRPPRSRFTRSQRVSTCMALLYLSMLANCMWYGTVPEKPTANSLKFGPFSVGLEQISIGFMSNIIIFPPSFFIVFLFRKARPRKLRPSRIDQALSKQKSPPPKQTGNTAGPSSKRPATQGTKSTSPLYTRPKRFTLPWWCKIVAWVLCFICMGVSIFFLWAYGITFGNEKTKQWLTSLLLAFFMSILITQPIKVFFLAMLFSAICKNVNTDEDDADEDEEDPNLHHDEEWLVTSGDPTKPRKSGYKSMINEADVEAARVNRMKEVKMLQILKELFGYFMFLWLLATVGYSSRDPNSFLLRKSLLNAFIEQRIPGVGKFQQITTEQDFWNWASNVLMPNLRVTKTYNDKPPFGMKGFLKDEVNRMLGYAIIRQIRMRPGECEMAPQIQNLSTRCSGAFTNIVHEDRTNYDIGWRRFTKDALQKKGHDYNIEDLKELKARYAPWTYTRSKDVQGNPTVTNMGIYSGGGYVMELYELLPVIEKRFQELQKYNWIDRYTRAVFVEFSSFNAQANMFGIVQMFVEFVPGGGILGDYKINTLTNISYNEGLGKFLLVVQILFVICILYFTVRELIKMCKQGCGQYIRQFWTWVELFILVTSYAAIAAFVMRMIVVRKSIALFNKTKGNKYINLQYAHLVDDFFAYCIAMVVFFAMMKFIKMLRFNNRMSALTQTLALCAKDLSGFFVFFVVTFMAFGQLFYLFFSMHLLHFQSYLTTIESMFSIMLNKFDYNALMMAQPLVGPAVFFIFALWSNIILINIFLSIIIISFESIKDDIMKKPNEFDMLDFVVRRFKATFGFSGGKGPKPKTTLDPNAGKDDDPNGATTQLPQKVDRLLEHINVVYFDGKLDLQSKEFLKRKHGRRSKFSKYDNRREEDPVIFQSN